MCLLYKINYTYSRVPNKHNQMNYKKLNFVRYGYETVINDGGGICKQWKRKSTNLNKTC